MKYDFTTNNFSFDLNFNFDLSKSKKIPVYKKKCMIKLYYQNLLYLLQPVCHQFYGFRPKLFQFDLCQNQGKMRYFFIKYSCFSASCFSG